MIKETEADKKAKNIRKNEPAAEPLKPELVEDTDRIGNLLCHERLKKGWELEDISQVLCIRRVYLEAIENGNYVELPPLPYSAGFVNSYAKYLGLNNTRITQLFREELNAKPREKRIFMTEEPTAEASLPDRRYIIAGIAALVLISLLWSLWHGRQNKPAAENVIEEAILENEAGKIEYFSPSADESEDVPAVTTAGTNEVAEETGSTAEVVVSAENMPTEQVIVKEESFIEPQAGTTAAPGDAAAEKAAAADKGRQVEIRIIKEDTWVEVRDRNKVYFNKIMRPGENYVIPDGTGMMLSAGKYKGVEVYVGGKLTEVISPNKKMNISLDEFLKPAEH